MKKIFRGKASKGKLILENQQDFYLLICSLEGKEVEVTLGKKVKKRSNPQNRYFHGVIIKMFSDSTGYSTEESKELLRMKFLSYEVKVNDEIIKVGRSTASLNTIEFEEFNSKCRQYASENLCIYIPDPNEIEY